MCVHIIHIVHIMDNVHVCTLWILYTLCTLRTMPTMNTNIQKIYPVPNSRYLELLYYPTMRLFQNHASTYSIQASTPALISSNDLLILSRMAFSSTRFYFRCLAVALCSFESPQSLSNGHFFFFKGDHSSLQVAFPSQATISHGRCPPCPWVL
jgi:hypothetical protein